MGLDITAVSRAAPHYLGDSDPDNPNDAGWDEEGGDVIHVYADGAFDRLDGYAPGYYRVEGEWAGFRAGSYSGYNWWRRHLSRMALGVEPDEVWEDPEAYEGRPFVELINFSDCEGCFGPVTSAKLAQDFRDHEAQAEAYVRENGPGKRTEEDAVHEWWLEAYREWRQGFELAADQGFLMLH